MITDIVTLVAVFGFGFAEVAARTFQQRNTVYNNWLSVIPTSYVMAIFKWGIMGVGVVHFTNERYLFTGLLVFANGTGGWLGCWLSMWLHHRVHGTTYANADGPTKPQKEFQLGRLHNDRCTQHGEAN